MIQLFNNDCLKVLPTIPDKSIDLILTDPPYGTTACKWDSVIPFEPMWKELNKNYKRQ
jgi:DNA modification methylase